MGKIKNMYAKSKTDEKIRESLAISLIEISNRGKKTFRYDPEIMLKHKSVSSKVNTSQYIEFKQLIIFNAEWHL